MKRGLAWLVVVVAPFTLNADPGEAVAKELKALQGTWKAVGIEAGGMKFPAENVPAFTYIVGADGKATGQTPQGEYQAKIILDPSKSPKTIVNQHVSGPQSGKMQYGIYKLAGDTWTVCMTRPGVAASAQPKDFNTKGTAHVVFTFERQKTDTKP